MRREYIFYGTVQGVGFRYRCYHLASTYHLTGNVRNQYDGSVKMEIQGDALTMTQMIESLKREPFIDISRYTYKEIKEKQEKGFKILY